MKHMNKKTTLCVMLTIILTGSLVLAIEIYRIRPVAAGTTWYVGPTVEFSSIQQAINDSRVVDGDTIEVYWNFTPYSEWVTVDKSLFIRRFSASPPGAYPTVVGGFNVTAPNVEISDFIINGTISVFSPNSNIFNNTVSEGFLGVELSSPGNVLINNTLSFNRLGILIDDTSGNNTLKGNRMISNAVSFRVEVSGPVSHFINDIDPSNTIDNKPIYYLVNETNQHVSGEAGYVAVVNSTGITVENLTLQSNYQGILAAYSSQINVTNVQSTTLTAPENGIDFFQVNNSTIQGVSLTDDTYGIRLIYSDRNVVANNVIASSTPYRDAGIYLAHSMNCSVVANNFTNLYWAFELDAGVKLDAANESVIFHNNFLNVQNPKLYYPTYSGVRFDNGYEGNYWSDYAYNGQDTNGTGMGPQPYRLDSDNYDYHPLIEPWSATRTFNRTLAVQNPYGWQYTMKLSAYGNSTLSSSVVFTRFDIVIVGQMNFSKGRISFKATAGYEGFLNVTIPRIWLDGIFNVTVDGLSVNYDKTGDMNMTCSSVYFVFEQGTHAIGIEGLRAGNIPGDINGDGKVSLADLVMLANNYGSHE